MRVAVVAHSFPRFPGDTHGPFVARLSEELAALGHEMHVLVPWDRELVLERDGTLTVHAFRYIWPPSWHRLGYSRTLRRDLGMKLAAWLQSPLYFAFGGRALTRLVRRLGVDLVHAHWILPNGYLAWRTRRATGVPYCVTLHGSDVFMAERNSALGGMAAKALAGAAHITSCSGDLRDRLLALASPPGTASDRVVLVPNGTDNAPAADPGWVQRARERWGVAAEDQPVVAVGRLVDKKGFDVLLDAFPEILRAAPKALLLLGGGGPLEDPLRERARARTIDHRVVFTGGLSHPEVLDLIAAADAFVMPSIRDPSGNVDGLPIVVLEAMAAGKPVVASKIAGIPLAVEEGVHGHLVPPRDASALAAAVSAVLADPERARAMGEAGRRRVETELNWGAIAKFHDRLYRKATAQNGR